jgi:probable phosphoglycerate mutase
VEGAESLEALYARTGAFLKEVVEPQLAKGKDILIVGHGAMNASIVCQIKEIPIEEFWTVSLEQCKLMRLL